MLNLNANSISSNQEQKNNYNNLLVNDYLNFLKSNEKNQEKAKKFLIDSLKKTKPSETSQFIVEYLLKRLNFLLLKGVVLVGVQPYGKEPGGGVNSEVLMVQGAVNKKIQNISKCIDIFFYN